MLRIWRRGILVSTILVVAACATGTDPNGDTAFVAGEDGGDTTGMTSDTDSGSPNQMMTTPTDSGGGMKPPMDSGMSNPGKDSGGQSCAGVVVINELQADGATASDEFVELYNPASCSVALSGFTLAYHSASGADIGGSPITLYAFTASDSIAANGYFVLAGVGFAGSNDGKITGGLAAGGGRVAILDAKMNPLDQVCYGTATAGVFCEANPATDPPTKKSIGRHPDGHDTDHNSTDFTVIATPSPGKAN